MVFFGDETNKSLSQGLATQISSPLFFPDIKVFTDGERRVRINEDVVEKDVVFLKTASITKNVDSQILETSFLIDDFKRSGARSITGILPYIPYSRADHVFRDGEAVPLDVVIKLFEGAGLSKVIFVDPHTIKMREMLSIEVTDVSALPLFAQKIREIGFHHEDAVIVSPDMGGLRRMKQLSEMLGNLPFASIEKDRNYDDGSISASGIHGDIKKTCFIVDDIISSGRTILQAVDKITQLGAEEIYVFATHPVFSEDAAELLKNLNIEKIFITDSIPVSEDNKFEKLEVLTLAPSLAKVLLQ